MKTRRQSKIRGMLSMIAGITIIGGLMLVVWSGTLFADSLRDLIDKKEMGIAIGAAVIAWAIIMVSLQRLLQKGFGKPAILSVISCLILFVAAGSIARLTTDGIEDAQWYTTNVPVRMKTEMGTDWFERKIRARRLLEIIEMNAAHPEWAEAAKRHGGSY